ncbi:MAG: hypothetical protein H0W62_06760 [Chitinophagales bacterium]|nr:hypothetical protein [Chitinophagales bacterium]
MKKSFFFVILFLASCLVHAQESTPSLFNPVIKFKGLVQARYEQSLSDSIDVNGKIASAPLKSNFRLRRIELRADITLNNHWSGVIRVQLPELKTPTPGRAIELAYFEYKYNSHFSIRGGQFKVPYELDELTSHEDLRMIDRGTTDRIIVSNNYASYQPGLMVFGTFLTNTPVNYYASITNGSDRSLPFDNNSQKNFTGRLEFYPIKSLRLAVNGQTAGITKNVTGSTGGVDFSLQQKLSDKLNLIVEGEYMGGTNILAYTASSDSVKKAKDFNINSYFGQALLRINIAQPWCRTFEIGGKYENTNPLHSADNDAFSTITAGIGFIFLPDNDARLQINFIHTDYQLEIQGAQKNNNMLVAQLQLKI